MTGRTPLLRRPLFQAGSPAPPFGPIEAQAQQLPATLFKNIISPIGLM